VRPGEEGANRSGDLKSCHLRVANPSEMTVTPAKRGATANVTSGPPGSRPGKEKAYGQ
jgi:hypothetical protein